MLHAAVEAPGDILFRHMMPAQGHPQPHAVHGLRGGANRDQLTGSAGNDVFVFQAGDMIDWNNLTGTEAEKALQFDRITDFVIGQDKINFSGVAGATQVSDFTVWKYTEGTNVFFYMDVLATHERILVDVADTVTWSQFTAGSNFIFN